MQCVSKSKLNRLKNRFFNIRALFLLCCISIISSGQASVDKITSSTPIQLLTPSTPIPESFLLDVGIPTFNDGLYLTDDDDLVFPEVRYAESIYFANQLAKVLERSGAWGAVRVIPNDLVVTDVFVKAIILHSDGEKMSLEVSVSDISDTDTSRDIFSPSECRIIALTKTSVTTRSFGITLTAPHAPLLSNTFAS